MRCIEVTDGRLQIAQRPIPKPGPGEVLIKVYAAGVNRPDILQRKGLYPPPPGVTDIPGLEVAGEVAELGRGVTSLRTGQKICALVPGGGYAEYCVAPAGSVLPLPRRMDMVTGAGIPETFFTVWSNLFDRAHLAKGETVLIHGGASGIGTTAIQLARAFGAKVFVTAGSDEKCHACKKLGATLAVNYNTDDFVMKVLRETKDRGVDVVLDMVGGGYILRNLKILATNGRHVSIAVQQGRLAEVDFLQVMMRRLTLTGSTLRPRPAEEKTEIAQGLRMHVWPLLHRYPKILSVFRKKRIAPVIDKVFTLSEAQAAHDYLDSGQHIGKVIIRVL